MVMGLLAEMDKWVAVVLAKMEVVLAKMEVAQVAMIRMQHHQVSTLVDHGFITLWTVTILTLFKKSQHHWMFVYHIRVHTVSTTTTHGHTILVRRRPLNNPASEHCE